MNERSWFAVDEADAPVDPTHIGVTSYRLNYENCGDLEKYFSKSWNSRHLYMDAGSVDWNLRAYLDALIARAPGVPVLQFNRVDFRLPWLRRHYPNAKILHLVRDPRDQWMSILHGERVPRDITLSAFGAYDKFYLRNWLRDLQTVFPCLALPGEEAPYKGHYLLWRLSQIFGETYADYSIKYEDLAAAPVLILKDCLATIEAPPVSEDAWAALGGLVQPRKAPLWEEFAPREWFEEQEAACDRMLKTMLP